MCLKLQEKLPIVTPPKLSRSRNVFLAASFAQSRIMFCFSKRSRQHCKLTFELCLGVALKSSFLFFFSRNCATSCSNRCLPWERFCCVCYSFLLSVDPITAIVIDPPHAVVIGQEAWFNVTLHSNNLVNPEEYSPSYGFVHFMWFFEKNKDKNKKPLLTWDYEVAHTFTTPGKHTVYVTAISVIGQESAHATVMVYG